MKALIATLVNTLGGIELMNHGTEVRLEGNCFAHGRSGADDEVREERGDARLAVGCDEPVFVPFGGANGTGFGVFLLNKELMVVGDVVPKSGERVNWK